MNLRVMVAVSAAAALLALTGCVASQAPTPSPTVSVSAEPSTPPSSAPPPREIVSVDEVAALSLALDGVEWRAEIGVSVASDVRAKIRATRAGHTSPSRCVDLLLGAELAAAEDRPSNPSAGDAIVTLGRAALPDDPAPEAIRVRVLADGEEAAALAATIRESAERCGGYDYVPDTHYREAVRGIDVDDATVAEAAATVVTWSDRTQHVDGKRLTRQRGSYFAGYLVVERNLVVWIEYDLAAGAPEPAHVDSALAAIRSALR